MSKVSSYQLMKEKEGTSGSRKKARSGAMSKDAKEAMISVNSADDGKEYDNAYKYSDTEAAQRAYDDFKAEAEMSVGMKKGGAIDLAKCKVSTVKANKSCAKW
jgi:hypothetical protein